MLTLLSALSLSAAQAAAPAAAPAATEDVITVRAERTGPRLWRVHDVDTEVYVFVTVPWLPEDLEWNDRAIESVLEDADLVITDFDIEAGAGDMTRMVGAMLRTLIFQRGRLMMPRKVTLADKVGPELALRFDAAIAAAEVRAEDRRARIRAAERDDDPATDPEAEAARLESVEQSALAERVAEIDPGRMHPVFQAGNLRGAAASSAGLSASDVGERTVRLARRADVESEPVLAFELKFSDVRAMLRGVRDLSAATNRVCIVEALEFAENDLPRVHLLAHAWASGDAGALRGAAADPRDDRCFEAMEAELGALETLGGVRAQDIPAAEIWTGRLVQELGRPGVRLAILDADLWLAPDTGVLDRLRAAGIEVAGP